MPTALPLPLSTPNRNLVRLTIVRGITWTGFLLAIIVGVELLAFDLPVTAVVSVVIAMGILHCCFTFPGAPPTLLLPTT